jgi:SAM-dependent methyltransferase
MSRQDRERWDAKHRDAAAADDPPSAFLVEHAKLLPAGRTLDLAAGSGRNAAFLARCGHAVIAVDVSWQGLARVRQRARGIAYVQMDLDAPAFRRGSIDGVVVVSFLDRRLFAEVSGWLRPGGVLLWDTFLVDQRNIGHPREAAFLLERGELAERLSGTFDILAVREGLVEEKGRPAWRSGVVARRMATESGL